MDLARQAGFDNLNLDLIYGLPGQSLLDWQHMLDAAVAVGAEHLSVYGLSLELETPLWRAIQGKQLPAIDPDLSADQYELAEQVLATHGYEHYEISNWARPGYECRHNLTVKLGYLTILLVVLLLPSKLMHKYGELFWLTLDGKLSLAR